MQQLLAPNIRARPSLIFLFEAITRLQACRSRNNQKNESSEYPVRSPGPGYEPHVFSGRVVMADELERIHKEIVEVERVED